MSSFRYHHQTISYTLTRNAKKNVNFRINNQGQICISAPKRVGQAELNKMILERADWLITNQEKIQSKKQTMMTTNPIENGSILYLDGKKYRIKLISGSKNAILFRDSILILQIKEAYFHSPEYINAYFQQWMKETMYTLSAKWMTFYLKKLQKYHIAPPSLTIRSMTSRWGSCIPAKRKITINQNLIYPPHQCLEYVVLHELAHLVEANHSKKFYAIIADVMPDWEKRRKMLNEF